MIAKLVIIVVALCCVTSVYGGVIVEPRGLAVSTDWRDFLRQYVEGDISLRKSAETLLDLVS